MSGQIDNANISGYASEAIPVSCRVKFNGVHTDGRPKFVFADAGEDWDGISQTTASAAGDAITVALKNKPGTFEVTTDAAIAAGTEVYGAADGEVSETVSGSTQFMTLEASASAGGRVQAVALL